MEVGSEPINQLECIPLVPDVERLLLESKASFAPVGARGERYVVIFPLGTVKSMINIPYGVSDNKWNIRFPNGEELMLSLYPKDVYVLSTYPF